jgi:hypothetical protein
VVSCAGADIAGVDGGGRVPADAAACSGGIMIYAYDPLKR